jgi:DNA replication protein DnaC
MDPQTSGYKPPRKETDVERWERINKVRFKEAREEGDRRVSEYTKQLRDNGTPLSLDAFRANLTLDAQQHILHKPNLTAYANTLPQYLAVAYQQQVAQRGRTFANDRYTQATIGLMAQWLLSPRQGILLRGNVGVGKTTMLYAIQSTLRYLSKCTLTIKTASEITSAAKDCPTDYQAYCKAQILGIDDLGTEPSSVKQYGNELSPIVEMIDKRYTLNLPTLITTNLIPKGKDDEIADRYGSRTLDRLREMCSFLTYDGNQQSYRQ